MDQKRLFLAIAISLAILLGFRALFPAHHVPPPVEQATQSTPASQTPPRPTGNPASPGTEPVAVVPPPREVPRLAIQAPSLQGSISLLGARFDDLVLRDYHEEVSNTSPLVRLLEPRSDPQPYYAQFGWAADDPAVRVPGDDTLWTASDGPLTTTNPVTLSWDNGAGLTFQLVVHVDADYMFTVERRVRNASGKAVSLHPWSRIRRDYTPQIAGYYLLHEGLIGDLGGRLQEYTYAKTKSEGKERGGVAYDETGPGGWAGITDKYWLTALVPDQATPETATFRHLVQGGSDRYQVDFLAKDAETIQPGADAASTARLFAGAKVVQILDNYEANLGIPAFGKAVDWGYLFFLTRPIFRALDWLHLEVGNFGVAILIFTLGVKALFFPLANRSYRSMSKMKLLGPKIKEMRERFKDDPARQQQEMMALYKIEKVNPVSGCLPMLLQVPVFYALYTVIFITIEMRHAPFFGWIHDLSAVDPTNVFTLFGLVPWNPMAISPFLHVGLWPLIMGVTMFLQQKVNPPPPDPMQARLFQFMPIIFTFMLARFPAGLVIYWSWNNTLTVLQQWLIMRRTRMGMARPVRT